MNTGGAFTRDEEIAQTIEREIQARLQKDTPPVDVAVEGATVTLTGHVANQATKDALIQLASGTPGVIAVTDDLVVGEDRRLFDWFWPLRNPGADLTATNRTDEV
jgi:osmotically-inducible protein OsmY